MGVFTNKKKDPTADPDSSVNQFARLMRGFSGGTYLIEPEKYENLHPGCIGYFDGQGRWNTIKDVSQPDLPSEFPPFEKPLERADDVPALWKTRSSDSSAGNSVRGTVGVSDAISTVGELSAETSYARSSSQTAALVTTNQVVTKSYKSLFEPRVTMYVEQHGESICKSEHRRFIEKHGLWAIRTTCVTDSCATKLAHKNDNQIKAGLDIAARGIGKVGGGAETYSKLANESWTVRESQPVCPLEIIRSIHTMANYHYRTKKAGS
jgi:hypothetical protein